MRLLIDPEWLIDCDESSCQLIRLVTITGENARGRQAKPENIGKQREEGNGFYGTLEQALIGYLYKRLQGSQVSTAAEVLSHLRESEKHIHQWIEQAHIARRDLAGVQS